MNHKQNVLIIGSGGREHVLAWKVSTSPNVSKLYVAPGNGGTSEVATNVGLKATDKRGLIRFAKDNDIGLTIVGPDDILALGMVDAFEAEGLRIFGPKRAAARIEWSKVFSKNLMTSQSIPTARYETFNDIASAKTYAASQPYPLVIKANGLALGKGVFVCADQTEADQALEELMDDKVFGDSGSSVVIEEFMKGQEVSIQALCDGKTSVLLPTSQDHKRIGTGDVGPNTGGMGTYAPVPWVKPDMLGRIKETVVESALRGLSATGSPFKGLLY
ncbi:MAG TPA: phosphoribosylamine--glycine ligase, partial [Candidatus Saccharimonadia bacterium]|nr:phosphoribosylamine--glycine ligase [Candidatus Saccharimonadia bacterium]